MSPPSTVAAVQPTAAVESPLTARRLIVGVALVVTVALLALLGVSALQQRRDALEAGRERTLQLARILAESTGRLLDGANLIAIDAAEIVSDAGGRWDEIEGSEGEHDRLRALVGAVDYLVAIWLTDKSGMPRLTSREFPAPRIDTSDREHFKHHVEADRGPFLSQRLRSRFDASTNIVLSRRLNGPSGEFRGIVQAVIAPDRLVGFVTDAERRDGAEIQIVRADGGMIVRYPEPGEETLLTTTRPGGPSRGANGVERVVSPFDGVERLEAYARVDPYGVYVSYGLPEAALIAGWRRNVITQSAMAAAALVAVGLLTVVALQRARREAAAFVDLERRVEERTNELKKIIAQRDTLLNEVNHRIKNNLQLVGSLLALQLHRSANEETRSALSQARVRVAAIADLHKHLYQFESGEKIHVSRYLTDLCRDMVNSLKQSEDHFTLHCSGDDITLSMDQMVPIALIVTELVTNAAKYAFPDGRKGNIHVRVMGDGKAVRLVVADDGVGTGSAPPVPGFGMTLVNALVAQLHATIEHGTAAAGTTIVIVIPAASASADPG